MLLYKHDSLPQFYHMRAHSSMAFQEKNLFIVMNLCVRAAFVLLKVSDCSRFASKREEMCVCGGRAHLHRVVLHEVCGRLIVRLARVDATETETDGDGVIYFLHKYIVDMSHFFTQACFIDGADLFQ